jgi:hypothetical protein
MNNTKTNKKVEAKPVKKDKMSMLLEEAIADAKAVRATALANAKMALEEAFAPKLQAMFSQKVRQEVEGDENQDELIDAPEVEMTEEEDFTEEPTDETDVLDIDMTENEETDDLDIDLDDETDDLDIDLDDETDDLDIDLDDETEEKPEVTEEEPTELTDDENYDDLDLEAIIKELEGDESTDELEITEDDEFNFEEDENDPKIVGEDEEIDLNIEDEPTVTIDDEITEDEEIDLNIETEPEDDELNIEAIMREIEGEEVADEEEKKDVQIQEARNQAKKVTKKLKESIKVIKYLRSKMNEVNLLNAKLLYANKLFRHYQNLTEAQKVKIIDHIDRARSLREIKLVFSTIAESLTGSKPAIAKKPISNQAKKITEGIASRITGSTKPTNQAILTEESTEIVSRFRKLANLQKKQIKK